MGACTLGLFVFRLMKQKNVTAAGSKSTISICAFSLAGCSATDQKGGEVFALATHSILRTLLAVWFPSIVRVFKKGENTEGS